MASGGPVVGRYFFFKSKESGNVLAVKDTEVSPGTPVVMTELRALEPEIQLWYYEPISSTIRCKANGYCLDVDRMGSLVVNPYTPDLGSQNWTVVGERLQNKVGSFLDISSGDDGTPGTLNDDESADSGWEFEFQQPEYFYIKNEDSGKVLDVDHASEEPGAKLLIYKQAARRADNQLFYEDKLGFIRCKGTNFRIDSSNDDKFRCEEFTPGSQTQQWVFHGDKIVMRSDPDKVMSGKTGFGSSQVTAGDWKDKAFQRWIKEVV